jgi:uncharacterized Ntn-hydrolase superfamily protein
MTFSLVAQCSRTGQLGVGALTAMAGVGKLVTYARAGIGAVATQAFLNPYYGIDGLRLMEQGLPAGEALARLVEADPGREVRQCAMVDAAGGLGCWTGRQTPAWSGHISADGYSAQGNRLVGPETLEAALEAFQSAPTRELAERLLLGLEAGEATGADVAGTLSGTIYVVDSEEYPLWDIRVDHADDPAAALRELYEEFAEEFVPMVAKLPTRADPLGDLAREELKRWE